MAGDPTRTLLVISELPHPWALLRDRLDPELVRVAWRRPAEAAAGVGALGPGLWLVAGTGEIAAGALAGIRGRPVPVAWVGRVPGGLPVGALEHASWSGLAADLRRRMAVELGGLRLAPGRGVRLPDGRTLERATELEGLLAVHPEGLLVVDGGRRLTRSWARAAGLLRRHHLALRIVRGGRRVALVPDD